MVDENELVKMAGEKIGTPDDIKKIYTSSYGIDNGYSNIKILYDYTVFYMQQFYGDYEEPLCCYYEKAETSALTFMLAISFGMNPKMKDEALRTLNEDKDTMKLLKEHWPLLKRGMINMKKSAE